MLYPAIRKQLKLYKTVDLNALIYGLQDFSNAMDSLLPEKKFKMIRKLQRLYEKPVEMIVLSQGSYRLEYKNHFEKKNSRFLLAQMAKCFETFDKESILEILNFSVYLGNVSETLIHFYLYKIYSLNRRKEGLLLLQRFLETLISVDLKRKLMGISAINIAKLETQYLYKDMEISFAMMFAKKSFSKDIYNMVRVYILKIYCIQGKSRKAIHILGELLKTNRIPSFSIMNILLKTVLNKNAFTDNVKRESDLMFFYNKIFSNLSPNFETIKILANSSLTYNEFAKLWRLVINHPYKNKIIEGCQIEIARAFLKFGRKSRELSNLSLYLNANVMNFLQYLALNVKIYKNTIIYLILCCSLFDNFVGLRLCFEILNRHQWKLSAKHYAAIYRQTFDLNSRSPNAQRHQFIKHLWMQNEQEALASLSKKDATQHFLVEYLRCMGSFNDLHEISRLAKKDSPLKKGSIIGFIEAFNLANAHTESLLLLKSPTLRTNFDLNLARCLFNNIQTTSAWCHVLHAVSLLLVRSCIILPPHFFLDIWQKAPHRFRAPSTTHLLTHYTAFLNTVTHDLLAHTDIHSALALLEAVDCSVSTNTIC
ncbi:hypothetical protein PMAC_000215 [Pneumocystis sp. 'macacae']|nr:hypothetical protein PMAC_000215 [Pneumocystis sp. 'macacae']